MNIEQMTPSELADKLNGLCVAEFAWPYLNKAATELRRLAARDAQWNALIAGQAGEAVAEVIGANSGGRDVQTIAVRSPLPKGTPLFASPPAPQEAQADSTPLLPVARIRSWTKHGEGHGDLVDWLEGSENLPDGEYDLYLGPQSEQKPVASIYISPNGEREFDDWKHDLPIGRNELFAAPVAQPASVTTTAHAIHEALNPGAPVEWPLEDEEQPATAQAEPMRAHVEKFAARSGWVNDGAEGAFEFVQRKCYHQGWQDGRREALGDVHRDTPEVAAPSPDSKAEQAKAPSDLMFMSAKKQEREARRVSGIVGELARIRDEALVDDATQPTASNAIQPLTMGEIRGLMAKHGLHLYHIDTLAALIRDVELEHGRGVANPTASNAGERATQPNQSGLNAEYARGRADGWDAAKASQPVMFVDDKGEFHSRVSDEQAEAPSDSTLKLAEMILSDCGHSTAISTRLRDRVAERIERHLASQPTASNAGERATADTLSFICTNGCGYCGVKLRDFVTHATQAQDSDTWVTVASEPEIVSTCCGHPVEVWDERKQDVVAEVRAALASKPVAPPAREAPWPTVPDEVMAQIQAYGDARADGKYSELRISDCIFALRRWANHLSATPPAQAVQDSERIRLLTEVETTGEGLRYSLDCLVNNGVNTYRVCDEENNEYFGDDWVRDPVQAIDEAIRAARTRGNGVEPS